MNKNESKYFNTAVKMDEALLSLLEKKDFSYITVKEICHTANVNRSTFYLHYENTSDLLQETTKYVVDKHFSYYKVDERDIIRRMECKDKKQFLFITKEYLTPYLTFVKENRRLFRISIKQFQVMNMDAIYDKMFKCIFEPILAQFNVPEKERVYVIKFYLTGVFAVVMEWLDRECVDEIDAVSKVIIDCVMGDRNVNG